MRPRIHSFDSQALLVEALYKRIDALAARCCAEQGRFSIVLAGGTTPRVLYQRLRHLNTDWASWHIYFGDERYLPPGDPARNDSMATAAWLHHVPIPPAQIHTIPWHGDVHTAAAEYASLLAQAPGFDLVLLGLGEDGHTASLFPGDDAARISPELAIAVIDAPKPPPQRISMSPRCLSNASAVWFIVTGTSKLEALQGWLNGLSLPVQAIRPPGGIDLFTDLAIATSEQPTG